MGVLADILVSPKTFAPSGFRSGVPRSVYAHIHRMVTEGLDFDYPSGFAVANQIQSIAQHVHATGGTYTLTFTLANGQTFTTGNINYNDAHAAVQTAINTAATSASITNWTNDDIVVAGAGLNSAPMTFTFSGASVAGANHSAISISTALTTYNAAQGTAGAVSTTTPGSGGVNAVQKIVKYLTTVADGALHVTGGTFTLTFNPNGGTPFTTAAIAWNADHATIQTAINTANGALGDDTIVVAGGDLSTADLTFTFSGVGVTHLSQPLIVVDSTLLTATVVGTAGAVSKSAVGQSNRPHLAALSAWGVVTDAPADQGTDHSTVTVVNGLDKLPNGVNRELVTALVREASILDNNAATYTNIAAALGLPALASF